MLRVDYWFDVHLFDFIGVAVAAIVGLFDFGETGVEDVAEFALTDIVFVL